jgi:hypothetical protein
VVLVLVVVLEPEQRVGVGGAVRPGWRWVFLVNLPVGRAVLAALPFVVRADGPRRPVGGRLDAAGALLVAAATALPWCTG